MTHRRILDAEDPAGSLHIAVPYCVEVRQHGNLDQSNRIPWSRIFLVADDSSRHPHGFYDLERGSRHALTPGSGWYLPPGRLYRFRFGYGLRMIAWHARVGRNAHDDACRHVPHPVRIADAALLHARAAASLAGPPGALPARMRGCLLEALAPLIRVADPPDPRIAAALELMDRGVGAGTTVAGLAAACRLRRETFTRIFRRSCGVPPHEALHARLVADALALLAGGMRVSAVAKRLDFTSPSACSRFLAARTGTAPGRLRGGLLYGDLR